MRESPQRQGGIEVQVRWCGLSYTALFLLTSVGEQVPCCAWGGGSSLPCLCSIYGVYGTEGFNYVYSSLNLPQCLISM